MGKYEPLRNFLKAQKRDYIPMKFSEIEALLHYSLPPSSRVHRAWWSNNPVNNVMTRAWLDAGYETEAVDLSAEKLIFRRMRRNRGEPSVSGKPEEPAGERPARHPVFGCMKGTLKIPAGVDLTEPADPEWGKVYDDA